MNKICTTVIFVICSFFSVSAFPYDIQEFCQKVAESSGGSYTILEQCIKQESAAKERIEGSSKPTNKNKTVKIKKNKTMDADIENINDFLIALQHLGVFLQGCGLKTEEDSMKNDFQYLFDLYSELHNDFPVATPSLLTQLNRRQKTICDYDKCEEFTAKDCKDYNPVPQGGFYWVNKLNNTIDLTTLRLQKAGKIVPPRP